MKTIFFLCCLILNEYNYSLTDKSDRSDYLKIPIRKFGNQSICTKIKIDGSPYWFCIDTGSGRSVVTTELAQKLQLKTSISGKVVGIGGKLLPAQYSEIPSIEIGSRKRDGIPVAIADLPQIDANFPLSGLIGSDFLEKHEAIIDYRQKFLYLSDDITHAQNHLSGNWNLIEIYSDKFNQKIKIQMKIRLILGQFVALILVRSKNKITTKIAIIKLSRLVTGKGLSSTGFMQIITFNKKQSPAMWSHYNLENNSLIINLPEEVLDLQDKINEDGKIIKLKLGRLPK